jgi:hypothetical protein
MISYLQAKLLNQQRVNNHRDSTSKIPDVHDVQARTERAQSANADAA